MSRGIASVTVDGAVRPDDSIPLSNDGKNHDVTVVIGEKPKPESQPVDNSESFSHADNKA
jgi:hypothetical protein